MLIEIYVYDKSNDTEDGFTLYSYSSKEISEAVKLALDNGFKDIRISESTLEETLKYNNRKAREKEVIEEYLPFN